MEISKAIEKAGGVSNLARELGVTSSFVSQWLSGHRPVPLRQWVRIGKRWPDVVTFEQVQELAEKSDA